ncbi:vWA domain-containing protein [Beutenbergia cavernae]|uniref:vWA domain-containing protein n=1 Tax=Beutenbergia cavernae TaxID=84757 RepID=UPI00019AD60D|nr:substrate-binding domain-containing protein [Beutenbergia cavernae]
MLGFVLVVGVGATATAFMLSRADVEPPAGASPGASQSADPGDGATGEPTAEQIDFQDDEPAAAPGAEPCTTVSVLSSFENAEMVGNLAAAYNAQPRDVAGRCVTVVAGKDKSGIAAEEAAAGFPDLGADERPSVWIPDASTWLSIAHAGGGVAVVPEDGVSVGSSNIVLAMPQPLADAVGWADSPPSWGEVFEAADDGQLWADLGHPEWGDFKLGKTSPLIASSGQAAMLSSYATSSGSANLSVADIITPAVAAEVAAHELSVSHYMATPEHFLWHARESEVQGSSADFLSAVIVDETSVWSYNRGITSRDGVTRVAGDPPVDPLVPIYPTDGFYVADNPAVVLNGSWVDDVERAAAEDFLRFSTTAQGQQVVRESGYRDLNGSLDDAVAELTSAESAPSGALAFPDRNVVAAVAEAFPEVRKDAQVLFLVDLSASMGYDNTAGQTRLEGAQHAITAALDHFTAGDRVGLAGFTTTDGTITPGLVAPVADIADNRGALVEGVNSLEPVAHTPLYQAVADFAQQQAAMWDPDRINAIVLLSDGVNATGDIETIGQDDMIHVLHGLHAETPVLVFTLGYSPDADVETLQAISSATGAHYYDATDPTEVEAVLGDLVTSF